MRETQGIGRRRIRCMRLGHTDIVGVFFPGVLIGSFEKLFLVFGLAGPVGVFVGELPLEKNKGGAQPDFVFGLFFAAAG